MEDKKRLLLFYNFRFFCLYFSFTIIFFFFLHLTHPQMESAVDEVRSFRCTVGSGQDAWRVVTTGGCHVRQNTTRPQSWHDRFKKGLELDWNTSPQRKTNACQVFLKYNCQLPTPWSSSSSENAHDADAEIKFQMICIDHIKKTSKQKCTTAMFFG